MSDIEVRVEKTASGFSAWSPGLPGCIATGATEEEARERMAAAIPMHLEALAKAGRSVAGGAPPDPV